MNEHTHEHKYRKQVVNRLARIEGHVRAIKEMAKEGRDCPDLLLQIAAARKALDSVSKVIFNDHIESCLIEAVHHGGEEPVLADIKKALDHFIR
ncbi:metal-sensing transcriptional repressor [Brevibacillus sp. 179-C9.3 HS]|uniref:metal-sensing transcriptional repressor n=1 Tax=unclassified Brevibacillus TaxID=2684853 RepID=UPI0039A083D0